MSTVALSKEVTPSCYDCRPSCWTRYSSAATLGSLQKLQFLVLGFRFNSIGEHGGRYSFQKPTNEGPIYLYYDQSSDNWCVGDQIGSQSSADLPQHSPKSRPHSSSGLNGAAFHCRHRPWIGEYRFCA